MANRTLEILGLFRTREAPWTVEELARETSVSASSVYRDVQELLRAGFLGAVTGAGYVLGPAFVEYDRLTRQRDPLIAHAGPVLRELLENTSQHAIAILCRRYRDSVMCVHQEAGSKARLAAAYERGVSMPFLAGASSKAILAGLDDRALKRIYLENEAVIRSLLSLQTWAEFRAYLRDIRKAGHAITRGEVTKGRVGIAAPILVDRQVVAGISLVMSEEDYIVADHETLVTSIMATAQSLSERMEEADLLWISR